MVEQAKGTRRVVGLGSRILGKNAPAHCPLDAKLTQVPGQPSTRKKSTKCRNGHGAHETGMARTNPVVTRTKWRAESPFGAPPCRSGSIVSGETAIVSPGRCRDRSLASR